MALSGSQNGHGQPVGPVAGRAAGSGVSCAHVGTPGPVERDRLAATLGAVLRSQRRVAGYTQRGLAAAVPCCRWTVTFLESGRRRPTAAMLSAIATALRPGDHAGVLAALVDAAGESLAPDSAGSWSRRRKAAEVALLAGDRRWPPRVERAIALHQAAEDARRAAYALLDRPGTCNDPAALDEANRLLDRAHALADRAGPTVVLYVAGKRVTYGAGM